jgi:hypothetical protein
MTSAHEVQRNAARRKRGEEVLAETFGWDIAEIRDYRYQRNVPAVYAIGELYYCVSSTKPKAGRDGSFNWVKYTDQFFAERANTVVWVADANERTN